MSSVNLKRKKQLNSQMNEVMDDFDRFEYFFVEHWKQIVYAAIGVVVAVAVIFSIRAFVKSRQEAAGAAFGEANDIPALTAAMEKYGSFDAADSARLRLAAFYIEAKEYAKAREVLAQAAKSSAPEIAWRAKLNLAAVTELEEKYEEAANAYADFVSTEKAPESGVYRVEAATAAGRLYLKAGKKDAAKELLEQARVLMAQADNAEASQGFGMQVASLLSQAQAQ